MNALVLSLWFGSILLVAASVVLAVVSARIRMPLLGALGVIPVALGLLANAFGLGVAPPHPVFTAVLAVLVFTLGVVAGSPITLLVLGLAERHAVTGPTPSDSPPGTVLELLRGGATIGYLERLAVLGCIVVGRFEGIAVIVAIKGLGRFSELDSPEARERFIIGTLVSLIWAGASGALLLSL